MRWYIEYDNRMVEVVLFELRGNVTAIAIEYKEPEATLRMIFRILIEYVLKLLEAYLVSCLAGLAYINCLIR